MEEAAQRSHIAGVMAALVTTLPVVAQELDLLLQPARGQQRKRSYAADMLHFVPSDQHPMVVLEGEDNSLYSLLSQATAGMVCPQKQKRKPVLSLPPSLPFGLYLVAPFTHSSCIKTCRHLRNHSEYQCQHLDLLSLLDAYLWLALTIT